VACHDFESFQQKSAEVFGINIGSFEILIMDEDDELACESQTDFED
jgi:hypothetical protein